MCDVMTRNDGGSTLPSSLTSTTMASNSGSGPGRGLGLGGGGGSSYLSNLLAKNKSAGLSASGLSSSSSSSSSGSAAAASSGRLGRIGSSSSASPSSRPSSSSRPSFLASLASLNGFGSMNGSGSGQSVINSRFSSSIGRRAGGGSKKRPRKPTGAYNYYFRDQCRTLVRDGHYADLCGSSSCGSSSPPPSAGQEEDEVCSSSSNSNKRRKSSTGDISYGVRLEDMGKTIARQWRNLTASERSRYEGMADQDAERYRAEIEEYYRDNKGEMLTGTIVGNGGKKLPGAIMGAMGSRVGIMGGDSPRSVGKLPSASNNEESSSGTSSSSGTASSPSSLVNNTSSNALSSTSTALGETSALNATALSTANKTDLQAKLAQCRRELLSDLSSLNEISAARVASGRPAYQPDAAARQRLYNLSVGPAGGSSFGASSLFGSSSAEGLLKVGVGCSSSSSSSRRSSLSIAAAAPATAGASTGALQRRSSVSIEVLE